MRTQRFAFNNAEYATLFDSVVPPLTSAQLEETPAEKQLRLRVLEELERSRKESKSGTAAQETILEANDDTSKLSSRLKEMSLVKDIEKLSEIYTGHWLYANQDKHWIGRQESEHLPQRYAEDNPLIQELTRWKGRVEVECKEVHELLSQLYTERGKIEQERNNINEILSRLVETAEIRSNATPGPH
ncbi:hypothetical protein DdX_06294 [Ditylenchus destructor]|uniref:Uncharacterized protein n=1 Tax=Ditylenchus destructor TaxID=166010 RepID=A0AAD4R5K8_9BILA|nr:hypothetical protein DdX_06294 [Ditylenchus destructor]